MAFFGIVHFSRCSDMYDVDKESQRDCVREQQDFHPLCIPFSPGPSVITEPFEAGAYGLVYAKLQSLYMVLSPTVHDLLPAPTTNALSLNFANCSTKRW